jgi:GNAT superfamily N-acetyltransferase
MDIIYRPMRHQEAAEVCALINRTFDQYAAPDYTEEGVAEFRKYSQPEEMIRRSDADHFALVATHNEKPIGVLEVRNNRHISLLFVDSQFHGRGIGRQLCERGLTRSLEANQDLREFTVNSSPYAVPIYEKLGFRPTACEQSHHGIRFVPMIRTL